MSMIDSELLTPVKWLLAGLGTAIASVAAVGGTFEPLISFVTSTSGLWLPIATLGGFQLAPEFGFPELGKTIAIGAILIYVGIKAGKLIDRGAKRLKKRQS